MARTIWQCPITKSLVMILHRGCLLPAVHAPCKYKYTSNCNRVLLCLPSFCQCLFNLALVLNSKSTDFTSKFQIEHLLKSPSHCVYRDDVITQTRSELVVFHVPGRGKEVEDTVENVVQVCVALIHQEHQGIAAGWSHQSIVTAALLPQSFQRWTLIHRNTHTHS